MTKAGVKIEFYLGQRVRMKDGGHIGTIYAMESRGEGIQLCVSLEQPIIIPKSKHIEKDIYIHTQCLHVLEFEPVDEQERDPEEVMG